MIASGANRVDEAKVAARNLPIAEAERLVAWGLAAAAAAMGSEVKAGH